MTDTKFLFDLKNLPLEKQREKSNQMRNKFPDRTPILVEMSENSELPKLDRNKFLTPVDLTFAQFCYVIRKRLKLKSEQALFLFLKLPSGKMILPPSNQLISSQYDELAKDKNFNGFIEMIVAGENTFGI